MPSSVTATDWELPPLQGPTALASPTVGSEKVCGDAEVLIVKA
jgi:hypothetical protein